MKRTIIKVKDVHWLQKELARKGFSIRSFCNKSGISNPTLYNVIDGHTNPSAKTANLIAETLGYDFEELFDIVTKEEAQ